MYVVMNGLGNYLKRNNISQSELAKLLGVDNSQVSRLVHRNSLSAEWIERIANVFNIDDANELILIVNTNK